jgi:AraC-like DNA-binding protein
VAAVVGLSERRFIQIFRDQVGLTPKRFQRLRRFYSALDLIASVQSVDWPDIALACGYYDQAHFIHEFREFSGLSPTEYLPLRLPGKRHVATGE